ncbi:hypothetical protein NA56DRAFT_369201 [Hyaloscypha hepaticicola]|uniref:Extracellular membrane protein CFEM domain-containing protein n=1 Tax=Hyaloscypha hepaticicola TaxID=2082293 RepID=A0A2J6PKU4_9HELO|nr:hypothetical protein NA56DRAFT_369201 [Hyaloscypha hepaticicola]
MPLFFLFSDFMIMFSLSATRSSTARTILFYIISLLVLDVCANCNNDKCLKALNSDLVQASSFCSTYTTNMAISTPSAISSGCKASSSKILSACSCIVTATTTTKTSSTTRISSTITKGSSSSSSHSTSASISATTSRSTSASSLAISTSTVTVTVVSTYSITGTQVPSTVTLSAKIAITTVSAATTCTPGAPCSVYELAIPSCVLTFIQQDFGDFQPNCIGIGVGPNFVKNCICPYLSQLPAAFSSAGACAAADVTTGLAYQQSECQCLGATIG